MAFPPARPKDDFAQAANNWDLDKLYTDMANAKQKIAGHKRSGLTKTEKLHLRGFLLGYSPEEIAGKLDKIARGVDSELSKTLYRYVEALTNRSPGTIENWRDVIHWLRAAGYEKATTAKPRQYWDEIPDLTVFYGRTDELTTLEQWIVADNCRLVTLLGMGGIGKTALAVKLAERVKDKFDYVIWRSLRNAPPLTEILADLIQIFSGQQLSNLPEDADGRISRFIEYLSQHRCIIILEDVQMVLSRGDLAGNYQLGYEQYGELFRRIGESRHQSCLLLTSWENPREISELEGSTLPVRLFLLEGLGAAAGGILQEKGLSDSDKWSELINIYRGNPLALKIVATTIQDLFAGSVIEYLKHNTMFLGDFSYVLHEHFKRLSELEKDIMFWLFAEKDPVSISKLRDRLSPEVSTSSLLYIIESVGRRSLIEKVKQDNELLFTLQPAIKRYVRDRYTCPIG